MTNIITLAKQQFDKKFVHFYRKNSMSPCANSIFQTDINGLVQDCSISTALAVEILQACTNQLMYGIEW